MRRRLLIPAVAVALLAPHAVGHAATPVPATPGNGYPSGPSGTDHAMPGQAAKLPDLDRLDPVRYRLKDAIVEHAQVTSRDGINRIWVDIIRPRTKPGVKVPTVMDMSPYFNTLGRGWKGDCKTPTAPRPETLQPLCASYSPFPEYYDDLLVPRGYAVALMDLRGTRNTSGCQVYGDRVEVEDGVDTVDWIADQPWSNGRVGLTGGSYDGTMATGVGVEQHLIGRHKDAVRAVIPIRAIDRWYDYHFLNGVPSAGHEATPALFTTALATADVQTQSPADDPLVAAEIAERKACVATAGQYTNAGYAPGYQDSRSDFWSRRDYVKDAGTTKTAFFLIHGLYDFNVKTNNLGHIWAALPASTPKKLWLEDADHVDPDTPNPGEATKDGEIFPFTYQRAFREGVHRWWAQYLKGLPAGALESATVEVQQGNGHWLGSRSWPVPGKDQVLRLKTDGKLGSSSSEGSVSYRDRSAKTVSFVGARATTAQRISGEIRFDLRYQLTGTDTSFTVQVDDLPPGARDGAPVTDSTLDGETKGPFTVTYGFARAAYAREIRPRGLSYPSTLAPVVPGSTSTIAFPSLPMDYVLKPGHRLRFTFGAGLGDTETALNAGGLVTILLTGSTIRLPLAG